jgi:hypothetical protein
MLSTLLYYYTPLPLDKKNQNKTVYTIRRKGMSRFLITMIAFALLLG